MNSISFSKIGLCLSGGGLRATFYHLGVIRLLREAKLLEQVTHVFSVSGGSILAAHLVINWQKYLGSDEDFYRVQRDLFALGAKDIRGRVIRRWVLVLIFLIGFFIPKFRRTKFLESEYSQFLGNVLLRDLEGSPDTRPRRPKLHILATSFTTGDLCSFSNDGFWIDDGSLPKHYNSEVIPLALAVAASSAFPPLFPPVKLTREILGASVGQLPYGVEYLTDGGVFDNLGFEKYALEKRRALLSIDNLLVSDAGASFDWDVKTRFSLITSRTIRATDILMKRLCDKTSIELSMPSAKATHIPITDIVSKAAYGWPLPNDIQRLLSKIRTDLDRFSKLEMKLLSYHGYEVAKSRLRQLHAALDRIQINEEMRSQFEELKGANIGDAVEHLRKSRGRSLGLFHFSDWTSYVPIGACACVLVYGFWWWMH